MATCIDPKELRSSQGPWGIPKDESASSRGGDSYSTASGSVNPSGAGGRHLHTMAITPKLLAPSCSKASSGQLGTCIALGCSVWGSGSSPRNPASSAGL